MSIARPKARPKKESYGQHFIEYYKCGTHVFYTCDCTDPFKPSITSGKPCPTCFEDEPMETVK